MPGRLSVWIVLLSAAAVLAVPSFAPAAGAVGEIIPLGEGGLRVTEYRLTTETNDQYAPAISGLNVVYTFVEGQADLCRVSVNGDHEPIVQGPGNQFEPDIDGTTVVYTSDVTGLMDIWLHDFATQERYKVTASFMNDYEPAVSGRLVVYTTTQNFNEDVFWFDTYTHSERPIASTSRAERYPAIDGNLVAWAALELGNSDIYAMQMVWDPPYWREGPVIPVATTTAYEYYPSVSGDKIAYLLDNDIAVFDVSTGETIRVTEDATIQNSVKTSGDYVFFTDERSGNNDIYMHDLSTGLTYQITDEPHDQWLTDADENRAVYYDNRYGSNDIFAVELKWNQAPTADTGPDQSVSKGEWVHLDGTGSFDPDGDPIVQYTWTLEQKPAGSAAELDDEHSSTPQFLADRTGEYILSLVVYDGELWSDPEHAAVTASNTPPVAEAGPDQEVKAGRTARLDGSGSTDPNGDPIAGWNWTIEFAPSGSAAELVGADTAAPTLTPDVAGNYVIFLEVYDGEDWSSPDWVTITAETPNLPPVAYAGDDQQVILGETVYLSGSGYDSEEQPITGWFWSIDVRPIGSITQLDDRAIRTPTFVPDLAGDYIAGLMVFDGEKWSAPDWMTVTVISLNVPPVADAGEDRELILGGTVQLDGSDSWDPDGEPVVGWKWAVVQAPEGSVNQPAQKVSLSAVAAGNAHSLVVRSDGSIVGLGDNYKGQCEVPEPNGGFAAAAAALYHSLGLKSDGSIAAWGLNARGECVVPEPNSGFVAVEAGNSYSVGLKGYGSVAAWGLNDHGQCDVPEPNSGFVSVSAGTRHNLGRKSDGSVAAWGDNFYHQCEVPAQNSGFAAVSAGGSHSLGLKADGSVVAWGRNGDGQCDVPEPNSGFAAIEAGCSHSVGLKADGSIVAWGNNGHGQCDVPEPNNGFAAIAAGCSHSVGLKADGSIAAWGNNASGQCETWRLGPAALFIPDVVGTYVLSLVAYDDEGPGEPDTVTINALPIPPPVADAGEDREAFTGDSVWLDGSGSYDPDGGPIVEYAWSFAEKPVGSLAALSDPAAVNPTFVPDLPGLYRLSLTVSDGEEWSPPDEVSVTARENLPPIADAGGDQSVTAGDLAHLDGIASFDPDGDPIVGFRWQLDLKPAGSAAALSDSEIVSPTFTADLPGVYQASLTVFDGRLWSLPNVVVVTAESGDPTPVAAIGAAKLLPDGKLVSLSGKVAASDGGDFSGCFYIEEACRSGGIRVDAAPSGISGLARGSVVDVTGRLGTTPAGERTITFPTVTVTGSQASPKPVSMPNRSLGGGDHGVPPLGQRGVTGGSGLNNVGLLVRTWGRVIESGTGYAVVDDGSGAPVRVDASALPAPPPMNSYVTVTGISGLFIEGAARLRLIVPRAASDVPLPD